MRKSLIVTLTLALLSLCAIGQNETDATNIKRSTDKVKIEGKYYYIHIVRKGETLYSISKVYNVSQVEIAMENPDIYLGLQVDQALKIPIKDIDIKELESDDKYIYHVVKRKETLFSLTRKYEVTIQDIIAANPEVEQGLKANQVVLIPKESVKTFSDDNAQESNRFIYHEVKPREGFYSITKKYSVSEETIRRFNEGLVLDGIKLGTVLRIPRNPNDTLLVDDKHFTAIKDSESTQATEYFTPNVVCDTFIYNRSRDIYNISLLLPFTQETTFEPSDDFDEGKTNETSTTEPNSKGKVSQQSSYFLDFYQGVLIALDSLKKGGLSVNLNVYNTEKSVKSIEALIKSDKLKNSNLIIGPAYPECLKPLARYSSENRIPLISPLSPNSYIVDQNPYFFQVNPSFLTQLDEFVKQIDLCKGPNIVLIHENDSTNQGIINSFKTFINNRINQCSSPGFTHFKEVTYKAGSPTPEIQERISHSLSLDRDNLILVPSNNEPFVSDLLGNLHTLSTIHKFPIEVYGFPRWQKFRNVQTDYFYQLELKLFTPFYIDYSKPKVKAFIADYRDAFRAEPTQYAFQGYDVAFYFLTAMKKYGVDFMYCINNLKVDLLQSEFNFVKKDIMSGYENNSIRMIRYTKDYEINLLEVKRELQIPKPAIYLNEKGQDRKEATW